MLKQLVIDKNCFNILCDECPIKKECYSSETSNRFGTGNIGAPLNDDGVKAAHIKLDEYLLDAAIVELLSE